jgi:hypothetical protein
LQINFNPAQYEPFSGYDLLPAGDLPVLITDAVAERTKDQTGGLLKVEFTVAQGHQFAGRRLFARLNLWHQSPKWAEIAHKQLTSLCYCVGIMQQLTDTDMLKNRNMIITINNDGTYNNVTVFKDAQGNEPGKQAKGGAPQQGQPGQQGMPQFGQQQQQPAAFQQPQQQPAAFQQPQQGQPQGQPQTFFTPPAQQPQQQQQPQQGFVQPQGNPFGQQPQGQPQQGFPAQQQQPQQQQQQPPYAQQQPQQGQPMPFPQGQQPGFVQPQAQQPQNPQQGFQQQPPAGFTGFPGQ